MLGGRFRLEMPRRFGGFFRNDADHRDFTAIGTAAGERSEACRVRQLCITSVAKHLRASQAAQCCSHDWGLA